MANQRILALDVGEKRIGVAVGDSSQLMALPRCVLLRQGRELDIKALKQMAEEEQASLWVLGLPRQADDSLGASALKILGFARRLYRACKIPMVFVDEWETTVQASQVLLQADVSRNKRRKAVDKLAATFILERYFAGQVIDIDMDSILNGNNK